MTPAPRERRWWLALAAVLTLALGLRLAFILGVPFDGLYGQDAYAHLDQILATRAWVLGQGPFPTSFFWPHGFALTALPLVLLLGPTPGAVQALTVICGLAAVGLIWDISRRTLPSSSPCPALLAALIAALSGQMVTSSVVVMSDMPALLWAVLAAWLLLRSSRAPRAVWWTAAAGAALGMAVITRWVYAVLTPAFAGWLLLDMSRRRRPLWHAVAPTVAGLVIVVPQALVSLGHPQGFVDHWMLAWRPANALATAFDAGEGRVAFALPGWLFYTQPAGNPRYLFPALAAMIPVGIWRLGRQRAWAEAALFTGWSAAGYLFLIGVPHQNLRFGLTLYPPLVVLASIGACSLLDRRRWQWLGVVVIAVSLPAMAWWSIRTTGAFLRQMNGDKELARQVSGELPRDATLLCLGLTATLRHYTELDTRELYDQDPASLARLLSAPSPLFLLIVRSEVEVRWAERPPGRALAWLQTRTMLREIRRVGPYTLYEVDASLPDRPRLQRQRQ